MEELLKQILGEVSGVKQEISGLKEDMSGVKQEITVLNSRMETLETEVTEVRKDVNEIKITVDKMQSLQQAILEETAGLMEFRTEASNTLQNIHDDLGDIHEVVGRHETSIAGLRRRIVKP